MQLTRPGPGLSDDAWSPGRYYASTALRYTVAPALVCLATVLIALVRHWSTDSVSFLLYGVAVVIATWFAGAGPGAVSIILSALSVDYFFIPPVWIISANAESLTWTFVFICACGIAYIVSLKRKHIEQLLIRARDQLEERVRERTAALTEANARLTLEIAERERTAKEKQELQLEMERMSRILTVGALTASITHEINQPLTSVVANGEAALSWLDRDTPDLARVRRSISLALAASHRAADILKHIRSLIDREPSRLELVSIGDVVERALSLSNTALHRHRVSVDRKLSKTAPRILGDRVQLEQLVLNLISNAIHALSKTTDKRRLITITLNAGADGLVALTFEDNGCGMQPSELGNAFKPFVSTKQNGMGMGLSIIRSIVQRHNGSIRVRSLPGNGTVFTFTFERGDTHERPRRHRVSDR